MKHLDHEIEATMNSLNGIKPVESNPFLITRIEAKLAQQTQPILTFSWRPALRLVIVTVLVAVNLMTLSGVFTKKDRQDSQQAMGFFSEQISDYRY